MSLSSFKVVIEKATSKSFDKSVRVFADFFRLPLDSAENILRSAPVVFLNNLSKNEVKLLKDNLVELSKTGIDFKVTTSDINLPEIKWASKPSISTSGINSAPSEIDTKSLGFTCPSCGELFLLKNVPQIKQAEQTVQESAAQAQVSEKSKETAEESAESSEEPVQTETVEETVMQVEEDSAEQEETIEPIEGNEEKAKDETIEELDIEEMDITRENQDSGSTEDFELESVEENNTNNADNKDEASGHRDKTTLEETGTKEEQHTEKQAPQHSNGEKYKVFVSSLKDAKKKKELVKIICDYRGISESEANRLTKRLIIPVAKDISKDKADELVTQLKKLSITAKKTKG